MSKSCNNCHFHALCIIRVALEETKVFRVSRTNNGANSVLSELANTCFYYKANDDYSDDEEV